MKPWNRLEKSLFAAFLVWSAAGLIFTVERISPATVAHWPVPPWLGQFVVFCLQNGDPILILLAYASTHLHAVRQWSAGIARGWGLAIILSAYGVEMLGSRTGFPFGSYSYTDHFGPMLAGVPLAIPLAWHVVVTNALFVVRMVGPYLSQLVEATMVAMLCTLYDFVLEPFATTVKGYWIWTDGFVPPPNYFAWFVISGLLVRIFAPTLTTRFRLDPRPWLILGITLGIFAAGRWAVG